MDSYCDIAGGSFLGTVCGAELLRHKKLKPPESRGRSKGGESAFRKDRAEPALKFNHSETGAEV